MGKGGLVWLVMRARGAVSSRALRAIILAFLFTVSPAPQADLISTTITVDGLFGDWAAVLANTSPSQTASDPEGLASGTDRDRPVQSTGRDLKTFAYTWDQSNLYFYVERWGSTKNRNWWWFYLDLDANGRMESTDKVFLVEWFGANQLTNTVLYNYVPATGSDPLVCEIPANCPSPGQLGVADGYDMLGGISGGTTIYSSVVGGSVDGVRLEARMPWSVLSPPGKRPLGFHVSSSNSNLLPGQIDDNMDGPGGRNFMFVDNFDLGVEKTSNAVVVAGTPQAAGNSEFDYILTVTNNAVGGSANAGIARSVTLSDVLPSQLTLVSATPTQGSFASNVWTIGTLNAGATVTLTLRVRVNNPPNAGSPSSPITVTNVANNLRSPLGYDINSSNNESTTDVTLYPAPTLSVSKTSSVLTDNLSGPTGQEFAVPGAVVEYRVVLQNTSTFASGENVVISDPLPTQVNYVAGSTSVQIGSGTPVPQTDAADGVDDTRYDVASNSLIVGPRTVNINSTTTVIFQVQVK